MNENMKIYDQVRQCPAEAQKKIAGGRLKGMTDINPMWRIEKLTELYGACGVGWYPEIVKQWIEEGAKGEKVAFTNINLFVKSNGEWSKPIPGTGGSMLVANERTGAYTSDEAYKMALTDAISVACKLLGFAADIYWAAGRTKYNARTALNEEAKAYVCARCGKAFVDMTAKSGAVYTAAQLYEISKKKYGKPYCSTACVEAESKGDK